MANPGPTGWWRRRPPVQRVLSREDSFPTADESFQFPAEIQHLWEGTDEAVLSEGYVERWGSAVEDKVHAGLRVLARSYRYNEVAAAEHAMNRWIAQQAAEEIDAGRAWHRPCRASLKLDPFVTTHRNQLWREEQNLSAAFRKERRKVAQVDELRKAWASFLAGVSKEGDMARHSVQLATDHRSVGRVVEELVKGRTELDKRIRELCSDAIFAHERLDVLDFVVEFDSALRDLMNHLEIPTSAQAPFAGFVEDSTD